MKFTLPVLLMAAWVTTPAFSAEDPAAAQQKVREEMKAAGVADPGKDAGLLNGQAYKALYDEHDTAKALNYFRWNVALFPQYGADLYDSLGDGYLEAGDTQKAIEAYEKSLALDPKKSDNGKDVVEKLKADPKNLKALQETSREIYRRDVAPK